VGTLLRSAEAAGVHGVLFPTHRQAPLTPAAIKASAGAVEHLLLCPVDDLPGALSDLRIRGLRVAAAEADAPMTAAQADLRGPLAIIVGSEGQGLSPVVRRRADVAVRIPMRGAIGSLNAAVAGSILLFAAVAQRDPGGEGSGARPRPATFDEIADASQAQAENEARAEATAPGPSADAVDPAPSTRKRARTPAPTTAAQKRARAARGQPPAEVAVAGDPATPTQAPAPAEAPTPAPAEAPTPAPEAPDAAPRKATRRKVAATATAPPDAPAPPDAVAAPQKAARRKATTSDPAPTEASGPVEPEATEPPATAKPPRRRAKAVPPSGPGADAATGEDPAGDDLLPGGPPAE
jgi:tRNA(Leu) C34 or U34 (ribose-2'-O)-methylase TrmL